MKENLYLNVKVRGTMKEGINVCKYVCMYRTERNGKTLWLLVKNQFLSICIQMINTHGDTIYMFLWVEEERQFLWNWFSDKVLISC